MNAAFTIPWNVVTAVVVPLKPIAIEFAVAVLPIAFAEMVKLPAAARGLDSRESVPNSGSSPGVN